MYVPHSLAETFFPSKKNLSPKFLLGSFAQECLFAGGSSATSFTSPTFFSIRKFLSPSSSFSSLLRIFSIVLLTALALTLRLLFLSQIAFKLFAKTS